MGRPGDKANPQALAACKGLLEHHETKWKVNNS